MPVSSSSLERVREAIRTFALLEDGERVIVGLSGGADSVFCTLALRELGYEVVALHVNHGLRPTALRDEEFVRGMCDRLGVPLIVRRVEVRGGGSIEERAREVRYSVFREVARETGIGKVCLAHNLSDAYETALFNLSRGTGLFGLVIPPKSGIFVRPLILLWRDEIREALRGMGVGWVEDESNYDLRFSRNFIRHRIVPLMEELFPQLPARFRRTYLLLTADRGFVKREMERYGREEVLSYAGLTFVRRRDNYLTVRFLADHLKVEPAKVEPILSLGGGKTYVVADRTLAIYRDYVALYRTLPKIEEGRLTWEHLNLKLVGDTRGVRVRARRKGERWLKRKYEAYGIPRVLRDAHPVVEREGRVVWVPGIYGSPGSLRFVKLCPRRPHLFDAYAFLGIRLRNP